MKRKSAEKGAIQVGEGGEQGTANSVALGDVFCIRLRGGSWWPAQVVDENAVSEGNKPNKKSAGDVLVRVYGSYIYKYVDPIECRSKFEKILEQNNGSYSKIFQQALEQDLPSSKSSRSKGSGSKTKANMKDASSDKKSNKNLAAGQQGESKKNQKQQISKQNEVSNDDPSNQSPEVTTLGKSPETRERRIRVMENLGLIAPAGSPFQRNGRTHNPSS